MFLVKFLFSLLLNIQDKLRDLERYSAKSNDVAYFYLVALLGQETHDKPEIVINYVIRIFMIILWLIEIIVFFEIDDIYQFIFVNIIVFFAFYLWLSIFTSWNNLDIVWTKFLYDIRTYNFLVSSKLIWKVQDTVAFMEVEKSMTLFLLPEPCFNQ